jgi:hypothetical protein
MYFLKGKASMPNFMLGNRSVFLVNGEQTQTVNVCDADNRQGNYEVVYRIYRPAPFVTCEEVQANCRNLDELRDWLVHRDAVVEGGRITHPPAPAITPVGVAGPPLPATTVTIVPPVSRPLGTVEPPDDDWIRRARPVVEMAIDQLVLEFLEFPYLHRVEHSLHTRLATVLAAQPLLGRLVPLGDRIDVTQLIHKEWPETLPREEKGNRRGNFDLAVLSPGVLRHCPSLLHFRQGRLAAPFVIEMGLDYDYEHLAGDHAKLLNSAVSHGYLVHLARETPRDLRVEQLVLERQGNIRAAYALVVGRQRYVKLLDDTQIGERAL